jgi:hypothetical protein
MIAYSPERFAALLAYIHSCLPLRHSVDDDHAECPEIVTNHDGRVIEITCNCSARLELGGILGLLLPEIAWEPYLDQWVQQDFLTWTWYAWSSAALLDPAALRDAYPGKNSTGQMLLEFAATRVTEQRNLLIQIERFLPDARARRVYYQAGALRRAQEHTAITSKLVSLTQLWRALRAFPEVPK